MRIIQSERSHPLDLLTVGSNGLVAAATMAFGVPHDVEVWEITSSARRFVHGIPKGMIDRIAFTPDAQFLFIGTQSGITIFESTNWTRHDGPNGAHSTSEFALSADGGRLVIVNQGDGNQLVECLAIDPELRFPRVWSGAPDWQPLCLPTTNHDGTRTAVITDTIFGGPGGSVRVCIQLHNADGTVVSRIPVDAYDPPVQLAFTSDSSKLLALSSGRTVRLYDTGTGNMVGELIPAEEGHVRSVAVHPSGPIAGAQANGTVTFWDANTHEPIHTLDWKTGELVSVAFSPDGALGAAGTEDGKVIVWDVDL